ncbi:crotonase/enoyl-CoA hydratase family protein [Thalassotalea euphylliae]|uniref:Crotonase/enoyl-CoA hydratase family protein n=1 Tax=Thalassotalea euphylliae TaxID=1655234 RepID=A0A3E0TYJ2_9GAMM|nr:crotonase/enoyl-CoA hydratase family protein [Thalassotalea euphylliae]REL29520.1 crotonase/enoyl-CoA hydratase family protein [Thalassotalea euphylliae]
MNQQLVTTRIEENIAIVTLNRPDKHNALNVEMFKAIRTTIKTLKKNLAIRAVIVQGEGVDFCTGLDVKSVMSTAKNFVTLLFKWRPGSANLAQYVSTGWQEITVPVIMVLHGRVWGGGLQIALGGDFRIAHPEAILSVMEARWGLVPDMGGTLALKEHLPTDKAKLLAMTGREITAKQAQKLNLITKVSDVPFEAAMTLAREISQQSPDAVAAVKKLYKNAWWHSKAFALARESWYQIKIIAGKNQRIKTYNQMNPNSEKPFKIRGKW